MSDSVAVWAERAQVLDWINLVTLTYRGERYQMVNMNVVLPYGSVTVFKTEIADEARAPIMIDAGLMGGTVPFVPVHEYLVSGSFVMVVWSEVIRSMKDTSIVRVVS